jgi:uncharacterized RDD family membrane protein YckC
MENPYRPPVAEVAAAPEDAVNELASRSDRLIAALIDGVILLALVLPVHYALGIFDQIRQGKDLDLMMSLASLGVGFAAYVLVNGYLLATSGQTVGKRVMKIRIVGVDDQPLSLARILLARQLPQNLLSLLPGGGGGLVLIDLLFIFSKDRRCLHDRIAGSKVVNTPMA